MYITNRVEIAKIAQNRGVDIIFLDLEIIGKIERQGHLDTVISHHHIEDVKLLRNVLTRAKLLVRTNPIHSGSEKEINRIIQDGADIVMLPYFKTLEEVQTFIHMVDGRADVWLLVETPEAVEIIDDIVELDDIDRIHIGLNDLSLGYKLDFMFELLVNGVVEFLCAKCREAGIPYGFGGIARLGYGILPADYIMGEHYRLASTSAILSRSFLNINTLAPNENVAKLFRGGVRQIRQYEQFLKKQNSGFYKRNREKTKEIIEQIVQDKKENYKMLIPK